jgi:2-desacetyl-2-hydroxyethyl bacteriochlorophyllide A dehydrogenase
MKAVCLVDTEKLEIKDVPMPFIVKPDDVLVKISYTTICGSDVELFKGSIPIGIKQRNIIGHESSGVIIDLGEDAKRRGLKVGDYVSAIPWNICHTCSYCLSGNSHMCNGITFSGSMCEYVVWKSNQIIKLPPSVSLLTGCLSEPLGTAIHASEKLRPSINSNILILGAGGGGLLMLQLLQKYTVGQIVVLDPILEKRQIASQLGATLTLDPNNNNVLAATANAVNFVGYDYVIDASGDSSILQFGFNSLARMGTLLIYSRYTEDHAFNLLELHYKEAKIIGSQMIVSPNCIPKIKTFLPQLNSEIFIQDIFPINQVDQAFKTHLKGKSPRVAIQM